ncbi:uncharacterized protein LY89DRAFT_214449 [Mollisia scopiformis]|uniref:Uncharacterized protein n=1 Tax=Mollisia scopiformis TaxID=149040 RepID=A0A194WV70_MOLSC|nr:uncharacterized protein LY89DRAFT_214449 [Mollisia scopiformis]KUJ11870.1 hypothetical protein LY89DRAFT_214449 [Mollisia scopiformis]
MSQRSSEASGSLALSSDHSSQVNQMMLYKETRNLVVISCLGTAVPRRTSLSSIQTALEAAFNIITLRPHLSRMTLPLCTQLFLYSIPWSSSRSWLASASERAAFSALTNHTRHVTNPILDIGQPHTTSYTFLGEIEALAQHNRQAEDAAVHSGRFDDMLRPPGRANKPLPRKARQNKHIKFR